MDDGTIVDWARVFNAFRWSDESRFEVLRGMAVDIFVEKVLMTLMTDKDESLKINLLVFLQENAEFFLDQDNFKDIDANNSLKKICAALEVVLDTAVDGVTTTYHLKSQVLVTTTTILITVRAIETRPSLFESFVEVLLGVIRNVTGSADRLLRGMACECLKELEMTYPGLLQRHLNEILCCCQLETTHVYQSYLTLFITAFQHASFQAVQGVGPLPNFPSPDSQQLPAAPPPMTRFVILEFVTKAHFKDFKVISSDKGPDTLSDDTLKRIRRCIAYALENSRMLTQWGLLTLVLKLLPFVRVAGLAPNSFKHHLFALVHTTSPLFIHLVLLTKLYFSDIFKQSDHATCLMRIFHMIREPLSSSSQRDGNTSLAHRLLGVQWVLGFQSRIQNGVFTHVQSPVWLNSVYRYLYPEVFDPLDLIEYKMAALCHCFAPEHFLNSNPGEPPATLLDVLICLDEFRYCSPKSRPTAIVFRTLFLFLRSFPPLCDSVRIFLVQTILGNHKFLGQTIRLIDRISDYERQHTYPDDSSERVTTKLMRPFVDVLVALQPVSRLEAYFPLVNRIMYDVAIDPTRLLRALLIFLESDSVCMLGNWECGDQILRICHTAMVTHPTPILCRPLLDLLTYCVSNFSDVDIRDHSLFYRQLLTHVSGDKMLRVLVSDPHLMATDENRKVKGIACTPKSRVLWNNRDVVKCLVLQRTAGDNNSGNLDVFAVASKIENKGKRMLVLENGQGSKDTQTQDDINTTEFQNFCSSDDCFRMYCQQLSDGAPFPAPSISITMNLSYHPNAFTSLRSNATQFPTTAAPTTPKGANNSNNMNNGGAGVSVWGTPQSTRFSQSMVTTPTSTSNSYSYNGSSGSSIASRSSSSRQNEVNANNGGANGMDVSIPPVISFPSEIFGLVLLFSTSPFYKPLDAVRIPYLCAREAVGQTRPAQPSRRDLWKSGGMAEENDAFPYTARVVISLYPIVPVPVTFQTTLIFSTSDGVTNRSCLQPLQVAFQDMFLPLLFSPQLVQAFPFPRHQLLAYMFKYLWSRVLVPDLGFSGEGFGIDRSIGDGSAISGAETVKMLEVPKSDVLAVIRNRLQRNVIPHLGETFGFLDLDREEELAEELEEMGATDPPVRVCIFLPPRYHLLLRFHVGTKWTICNIRTDNRMILRFVDPLFDELLEEVRGFRG